METEVEYQEKLKTINSEVSKYLEKNIYLIPLQVYLDSESRQHIIDIGVSIYVEKKKMGPPPGSFVEAVCENDLSGAIYRADNICRQALPFFVTLRDHLHIEWK